MDELPEAVRTVLEPGQDPVEAANRLSRRRRSDATLVAYAPEWIRYRQWCRPPLDGAEAPVRWFPYLPTTEDALTTYVDELCQLGRRPGTIMKIKSAIRLFHELHGQPRPDGVGASAVLSRYTAGLKDEGRLGVHAEASTLEQVVVMLRAIDRGRARGKRDAAMVFLVYCAALTPGQLVALPISGVARIPEGVRVVPPVSRHGAAPTSIAHWLINGEHHAALCPVEAILDWTVGQLGGVDPAGLVVRPVDRHDNIAGVGPAAIRGAGVGADAGKAAMSPRGMAYILAGIVLESGLARPARFEWESLRRGGIIHRRLFGATADELADALGLVHGSIQLLDYVRAADEWAPRSTAGRGATMVDIAGGIT